MEYTAKFLINSDLDRYGVKGRYGIATYIKYVWIAPAPGIAFSFAFRLCQYYRKRNKLLFYWFFWRLRRVKYNYGFDISYRTQIGPGLYIGHFGGIVIHGDAIIGENCNLSQGMTIGILNRGKNAGIPKIGDRVFIGPNAVILGGITIGSNALIGANSVVTDDVPENGVVAAPASQLISEKGSNEYIQNLHTQR